MQNDDFVIMSTTLLKHGLKTSGDIIIPDGVTHIDDYAFSSCGELTSVTIPDSVTNIGYCAFANCSNLTIINIPTSVTKIEPNAFYGTAYLNDQLHNQGFLIVNGILLDAKNIGGELTIPDTVIKINESVFADRIALTSVILPDGITEIGDDAFMGCNNLVSINIPKTVTSIGRNAFALCYKLNTINLPDSVTTIEGGTFADCSNLVKLNIPDSVTEIEYNAFANVPLVIYDGSASNYDEWGAKKVVKSDGTVLYENTDDNDN